MGAGFFRHKISFYEKTKQKNKLGFADAWRLVRENVPAHVKMTQTENLRLDRSPIEQAAADIKIFMRFDPTIKSDWRIVFEGREFEILGVPMDKDGKRREMVLLGYFVESKATLTLGGENGTQEKP